MKIFLKIFSFFLALILTQNVSFAQNLDKIGKKDMVTVNGGVNYNGIFYAADGIPNRRPPYTWFFNGNLNINILDLSLPFTYSYSNLSSAYTQPFNMTSCAPTYKWAKAYAGFTSMNFSNYTLAGHIFLGGGIELTPKNWKIMAMYGRLKKEVEFDAVTNSDAQMSFRRMGYGAKIGYEKDGYGLNLIYFTAKDDPNSLHFHPGNSFILPQENTVVSATGKAKITKFISLEGEYALSGLTRNTYQEEKLLSEQTNPLPFIFRARENSQFFATYKASLNFTQNIFSCGLNYEHVDPDYKTLGAYYFNNDLENITISPALRLLRGKLNLAVNTGFQHNNLDKTKFSTNQRYVTAANISYAPTQRLIFNATYSNFTSYTRVRPITDPYYQRTPADTLNFYQLSQNGNASASYNFGGQKLRHTIVLVGSYQVSNQTQSNVVSPPTTVSNGNLSYNLSFAKSKMSAGLTYNYNEIKSFMGSTVYTGPGLTLGKGFFNNALRFSLANIFNQSYTNSQVTSLVLSERATISYSPKGNNLKYGKTTISLNAMYTNKFKTTQNTKGFEEFTGTVNLGYNF